MKHRRINQRIDEILFNGYVAEPLPIVLITSIVGVAFIVLALWATCDILFSSSASQTATQICVIIEYEDDGPICVLKSDNGDLYDFPTNSIETTSLLNNLVSTQLPVVVEYISSSDETIKHFDALSLSNIDGTPVIHKDVVSMNRKKNANMSLFIIWIACAGYLFFAIGSYYILSNAPKYPRLASLLIRAPYRNF